MPGALLPSTSLQSLLAGVHLKARPM
jgi:hypothetical protein